MKTKMKIKISVDFLMTMLLILLMAYQITGQELHEWIGMGMLILFVAHNLLNVKWYGGLFKGKYRPVRIIQTMVNACLLIDMLCLGFSGAVMSRHVFAVFQINGPMATARNMHMSASYWSFVLISIHIGLHWSMILGKLRKLMNGETKNKIIIWILRAAAALIAGYGLYLFLDKNIISYMFLKIQFVFFDFDQRAISVFAEYLAMMGFWIFTSYYISKGIGRLSTLKTKRKDIHHEEN